jgi:hypothetical protein
VPPPPAANAGASTGLQPQSETVSAGPSEPLGRAVTTALFLTIGAVILAVLLFVGININDPHVTGRAAATPSTSRQVVEQTLKTDLTADRLNYLERADLVVLCQFQLLVF